MDKIEQLKQQKQYEAYVKKITPQHNVWFNMMKAFFLGGTICLIGQCIIISVNWKNFPRMTAAAGLLFCSFSWVSFSPVPEFIHCLPNGAVPVHLFRLPALPTLLLHLQLNIRRRGRFLVLAVRSSRLPGLWSCMELWQVGRLELYIGYGRWCETRNVLDKCIRKPLFTAS